ncbi:hypothetical protein J6590_082487 [Homalodisca vitripennis]|nr:hypothetical protein J6590_082487 [Homalodisca vitripennis]
MTSTLSKARPMTGYARRRPGLCGVAAAILSVQRLRNQPRRNFITALRNEFQVLLHKGLLEYIRRGGGLTTVSSGSARTLKRLGTAVDGLPASFRSCWIWLDSARWMMQGAGEVSVSHGALRFHPNISSGVR